MYPFLGRIVEGRYLLDRFLDSGASGHVYRARALSFSRLFAIKIVDTGRYGTAAKKEEMALRFHREVETMSQIRNPHVVDVYEAIDLGEGVLGLVMDYINGETLDLFLEEQGRLGVEEAVNVVQQVANGLHEAHRLGIIHRDLKPQNVMIEALPAAGFFVRLLDFGIAQVVGTTEQTYGFQGTPLYASPEQCLGNVELDARSDIYSLGCLFFHLLTGKPPFPFTNALRVMDAHIEAPRPQLSEAVNITFPEELQNLISHLLARDREERPGDLGGVFRDLTAFSKGQPMSYYGQPPAYIAKEPGEAFAEWEIATTPPSSEFVSLSERTSNELGVDPTFSEFENISYWHTDSDVDLIQLAEFPAPVDGPKIFSITAVVLDRHGMACGFADHGPNFHLMELKQKGFRFSMPTPAVVSSAEIDLMQGRCYLGNVRNQVLETAPGATQVLRSVQLPGSPLAMSLGGSGQHLYFGTERGQIYVMDLRTRSLQELVRLPLAVSAIHVGARGEILAGLWDGSVAGISLQGRVSWHLPIASDSVAALGFLTQDRFFAIDGRGTLLVGKARSGEKVRELQIGPGLRTVRQIENGKLIGLSLFGAEVQTWELKVK